MSEADWEFFDHRWKRYVRQTKLTGQNLMDELWATLDVELERLAFHDNIVATNETELLKEIKKLAVTILHPSVHIVALHEAKQDSDEPTKLFSARIKGIASNCNLRKKCSKLGCTESVSFVDETCYHVVMAGLSEPELKEKVLTQAMLGTVKDLPTLLAFANAEESARAKHPSKEIAAMRQTNKK